MKILIFALLTLAVSTGFTFAQSNGEQEIRKIHASLEQAFVKRDISVFEALLADDYSLSNPDGTILARAAALEELRKDFKDPSRKAVSETSDDLKIKVIGEGAYVTCAWTSVSKMLNPESDPHTDNGRYIGVYERRKDKWMLVAEMFTEAQHDRKLMEAQILATSNLYDVIMKSRNVAAYERLLHADYIYTSEDGEVVSRSDEIAHFSSPDIMITTPESTDKKIRILNSNTAVETGKYHVVGTNKGKPFDQTGRYTTTWIWRELRRQIIADHNSEIKK